MRSSPTPTLPHEPARGKSSPHALRVAWRSQGPPFRRCPSFPSPSKRKPRFLPRRERLHCLCLASLSCVRLEGVERLRNFVVSLLKAQAGIPFPPHARLKMRRLSLFQRSFLPRGFSWSPGLLSVIRLPPGLLLLLLSDASDHSFAPPRPCL